MSISPFSSARFEYENDNLYYLPEDFLGHIETFVPKFLVGSRGTGKTTFLRALWWKERLKNESLKEALDGKELFGDYIGLYLKLPTIQVGTFTAWTPEIPPEEKGQLFSLYLDLLACQQAVEAVLELGKADKLSLSVEAEYELSDRIASDYRLGLFKELADRKDIPLKKIERILWLSHNDLVKQIKAKRKPELIAEKFPCSGFGVFCRIFMEHLQSIPGVTGKSFKVCFDECECLSHEQLLVLNTMIRTTEAPVTYVAAFVRKPHDMNETYIPNLTLQRADREIIPLDSYAKDDKKFESFVDGVATVRIRRVLEESSVDFETRKILGNLNINKLLELRLKTSESPKTAREILNLASNYAESEFYKEQKTAQEKEDQSLPIYYAYLCDRLELEIPTKSMSNKERRNQESREIRKKMVGAYLSICRECKMDVWYAYTEMMLQSCDSCLRDYLWQMQSLFERIGSPLTIFISKTISEKTQNEAFKKASKQKHLSIIVQDKIRSPEKTERLIDGLAKITSYVQTTSPNNQHLRSTEKGIFNLRIPEKPASSEEDIIRIIEEASEAGFLRIITQDPRCLKFRVHTSLAPEYGFSYRGAYYDLPVNFSDLSELLREDDRLSKNNRIEKISKKLSGCDKIAEPLFEGKDVWNV